jgi:hypothetical protein
MIISKIILENCLYYHLHAEQTITAAFTDSRDLGILEKEVTKFTFEKIILDYNGIQPDKPTNLILNFEGIEAIQNNLLPKISELRKLNPNLVLINIKSTLIKELGLDNLFNNIYNKTTEDGNFDVFYVSETLNIEFSSSTIQIFENRFLQLLIEKYIDSVDVDKSFHSSSSVYLPKWINIKNFISNDKAFFIYAIYHLAIKTYAKWKCFFEKDESYKPILVCQNLNSSYISSILSNLLKTDILILDQIGPINKMYSTLDSKIENSRNYVVVSDLVCLGTEVKIAKSLIEFLGGNYLGNISIIRIQTIDPKHKDFRNTECVFTVDKTNNIGIRYEITTDLDN